MGYGNYKNVLKEQGGGGKWFDWKTPGNSYRIVLLNDLVWGPCVYTQATKRTSPGEYKTGKDGKIEIVNGDFRAVCSAYCPDESNDENAVKPLEQPLGLYATLGELSEDVGDLTKCLIKVTRVATSGPGQWKAVMIRPIREEELEKIAVKAELVNFADEIRWLKGVDIDKLRNDNLRDEGGEPEGVQAAPEEDDDDIAF